MKRSKTVNAAALAKGQEKNNEHLADSPIRKKTYFSKRKAKFTREHNCSSSRVEETVVQHVCHPYVPSSPDAVEGEC
jgi:hypothetical protein